MYQVVQIFNLCLDGQNHLIRIYQNGMCQKEVFYQMFQSSVKFNQDISGWDFSNGIDLGQMFTDAKHLIKI